MGQALYKGEPVFFISSLINFHSRKPEYLVVYENRGVWIQEMDLDRIVHWTK